MTTGGSTNTPRLTVLALLDAYQTQHDTANDALKQSLWNLHKARHHKSGNAQSLANTNWLSALDVREELRARAVLQISNSNEVEPDLLQELSFQKPNKESSTPKFTLVDPLEQRHKEKENETTTTDSTKDATSATTGLRNRKKTTELKTESSQWTTTEETTNNPDPEEERLLAADPMDLFGALPPRDLKVAQTQAKQALEHYIQAANLLIELQQQLK